MTYVAYITSTNYLLVKWQCVCNFEMYMNPQIDKNTYAQQLFFSLATKRWKIFHIFPVSPSLKRLGYVSVLKKVYNEYI